MSGDPPITQEVGLSSGIVLVSGPPNTIAAHAAIAAADRGARVVFVTLESTGTIMSDLAARVDELFRERETIDVSKLILRAELPASVDPPILLKKSAYERANPNQPFYAKLRREDKKKNRNGKK